MNRELLLNGILISFRFLRERRYVFHCEAPEFFCGRRNFPREPIMTRVSAFVVELFLFNFFRFAYKEGGF